ncbi:MAG: hypothetical protein [Wigfec virus K19_159]|nr:MAG: hypothetical protein [Wigfec virus K19_159]
MHLSEHDLRAEQIREEEKQKLIEHYMQIAMQTSEEYGFLNVRGHEVPDPTVVEPPLGYVQQPDLMETMRRMVRTELSKIAENNEFETFEEADDFEIDEDPVDSSPYEMFFDPPPNSPGGPPAEPHPLRADPNAPKDGEVIPPQTPQPPPDEPNKGA